MRPRSASTAQGRTRSATQCRRAPLPRFVKGIAAAASLRTAVPVPMPGPVPRFRSILENVAGPAPPARLPSEGDVIAQRYRIVRKIAEGGMAAVYEAVHLRLRQRVALKILFPDVSEG